MEKMYAIIGLLFLLSTICERIAEFLKTFLTEKKIGKYYIVGNTATKYPEGSKEEHRRAYRILKINLVCGFITAFLCHASLFDILRSDDNFGIGWPETLEIEICLECWKDNISFLLGCLMTGAFISLGSKFWHDLLDIILAVKTVRQNVAQQAADQFSDLTEAEKFQVIEAAIKENKEAWKNSIKNYQGVSVSQKLVGPEKAATGELAVQFNVSQKEELKAGGINTIPEFIYYAGYKIPTDVIGSGNVAAGSSPIDPDEMPRPLGSSIGRTDTGYSGTLGLQAMLTVEGKQYLCGMSCYHVLFPSELKNGKKQVYTSSDPAIAGNPGIFSPSQNDHSATTGIGAVIKGKLNGFIDIGFFRTTSQLSGKRIFKFGKIKSTYAIAVHDAGTTKVRMCGRTSGLVEGTIDAVSSNQNVTYFSGTIHAFDHELEKMIRIKISAREGDSGSAVVTEANELVGILTAADANYGYVIPMAAIAANFAVTFEF